MDRRLSPTTLTTAKCLFARSLNLQMEISFTSQMWTEGGIRIRIRRMIDGRFVLPIIIKIGKSKQKEVKLAS